MDNVRVLCTSFILGAISLIPYNRYILWSLVLASLVLYAGDCQRPSNKLGLLQASIDSVGETLELANKNCKTNYAELVEVRSEFSEIKSLASNIKCQLLESRNVSTWNELKEYVRDIKEIWQSINGCKKKVEEIRTSILRLIEVEYQRELSEDIQTSREIISSFARHASALNRRIQSSNISYESM
ncbi:hypothetical protein C8R45DRAFT_1028106 [Mycena sanguinolenta]|nr:hypothetical protein C8R45DRAFT_1028106 [Mycena sanguinolenta]